MKKDRKNSHRVPLRLVFGFDGISLAINTQNGEYSEEVRCESFGMAGEMTVGINTEFLMDVLNALDCNKFRIEFNSELSPMKIVPTDGGDKFVHLLLPVRLKNRQAA